MTQAEEQPEFRSVENRNSSVPLVVPLHHDDKIESSTCETADPHLRKSPSVKSDDGRRKSLKLANTKIFGRDNELEFLMYQFNDILGRRPMLQSSRLAPSPGAFNSKAIFLQGESGTGKTFLVQEFRRRLNEEEKSFMFINGKFSEPSSEYPLVTLSHAIDRWMGSLSHQKMMALQDVSKHLVQQLDRDDLRVLVKLIPSAEKVMFQSRERKDLTCDSSIQTGVSSRGGSTLQSSMQNIRMHSVRISNIFSTLLRTIAYAEPLVLFFDDLQWADQATLNIFRDFLTQPNDSVFFIGALRARDHYPDHPAFQLMNQLEYHLHRDSFSCLSLKNLSIDDTSKLLADILLVDFQVANDLAAIIHIKTYGNVNHTIRAVEELHTQGAIYFDQNYGSWSCSLDISELRELISDSAVQSIKQKLVELPGLIQQSLAVSSYIRHTFNVEILLACLKDLGVSLPRSHIKSALQSAVGYELLSSDGDEYTFVHDTIQDAASSLVFGGEKDKLLISLGATLSRLGRSDEGETWMLYAAAHHWNTTQEATLWPISEDDKLALACLNMDIARLFIDVAGFSEAANALKHAIDCIDENESWEEEYPMMLEMCHLIMDTEYCLGNYATVRVFCAKVLEHGKNLEDKGAAFVHSLSIVMQGKDRDHDLAIKKGMAILQWHGIDISVDPKDVKPEEISDVELACADALDNRKVVDLKHCHLMEVETVLTILERMAKAAIYSGKLPFCYFLGQTAIRICAMEEAISEYLPRIYMYSQMYYRKNGLNYLAYDCAATCKELIDDIPNASTEGYCTVTVTCNNGMQLFNPCHKVVPVYQECYGKSKNAGDSEFASLIANSYGMSFFLSGTPLTNDTTRIFKAFEEDARSSNQPPSVYAVFMVYRQLALNLRYEGATARPYELNGESMQENILLSQFEFDTNPYKQTRRDVNTCKLMAACIFQDLATMEKCIAALQEWPDFDVLLHRLHMRLGWQALAITILARTTKQQNGRFSFGSAKEKLSYFSGLAKKYLELYRDLSEQGNPNARTILLCLEAEQNQSKKNYEKAILVCKKYKFLHLEALMNENCGRYQSTQKKEDHARRYLKEARRLYLQYGAHGKVKEMGLNYSLLR